MSPIVLAAIGAALWLLSRKKKTAEPLPSNANPFLSQPKPAFTASAGKSTSAMPSEKELRENEARLRELYFFHPVNVPRHFKFIKPSDNHELIIAGWSVDPDQAELINEDIVEEEVNKVAKRLGGGNYGTVIKNFISLWYRIYGHAISASSGQPAHGPRFKAKNLRYPFGYNAEVNRLRALGIETSMPRGIGMYKNWKLERPDPEVPKDGLVPVLIFSSPYDFFIFWTVRAIELYGAKQDEKAIAQDLVKARGDEEWAKRLSSVFR